ncbi:(2Fe-2S)-binding protein [Brooklawnia cerclae]|uniref:Molibdopterin-dependent oxidoreductase YjgC n=1 Tax=Brooklawnia cerclae TaxID=349934 RepID=A0ABX0SKA2_9ACTN|nr:(2Fe-2S)-binding protein [Brooklawnia cerclae]NIH58832.1 putative molibdopterin-dependent oxidoreductase YjgC [Brooklawnia cerclae]
MTSRAVDPAADPIRPERVDPITVRFDGVELHGVPGNSIAAVLLANGITSWRVTRDGNHRGVFCGIGVCFDCVAEVNGRRDVRLCQRRACEGDDIRTQDDHS